MIALFVNSSIAQKNSLSQDKIETLDSLFTAWHKADEPGSAFGIIKNGELIYQNQMGMANIEHQIPITDNSIFNIASVSKQFTTYLALHLEDQGKLSFQDDIREYLPELKDLPYKITIEQLTNHTHGLPNPDELAQLKGQNQMHSYEVLEMLLNIKTVNFKPGDDFQYNNTGYFLLSEIITRLGEKPFVEQLEDVIFKPLGMNKTKVFGYRDDVIPNKAYSYVKLNSGNYAQLPSELATIGSSGIYSSLQDMLLWANNFQETTVEKAAFYERMQQTVTPSTNIPAHYGLGLEVNNYKGIDIVFHGGGTESYRSYILHAPAYDLSFVFLSNQRSMAGLDIVYGALETLVPASEMVQEKAPKKPSKRELKSYEGTYEIYPGTYYTFLEEDGELYWKVYGQEGKYAVPALDKNVFKAISTPHSTFTFLEGRMDYQIADMVRYCYKIDLPKAPTYNTTELGKFTGLFKNKELDTRVEMTIVDGQLVAKRQNQYDIPLKPFAGNQFFSLVNFFGRIDYLLDETGEITGFKVSGQNLEDVVFEKE